MQYKGYRITSDGKVFSEKTGREMIYDLRSGGGLGVKIIVDGKRYNKLVHRLVAELFIPNPDNKQQIDHIDGDKHNNSVENLRWCTDEENQSYRHEQGSLNHGSKSKTVEEYRDGKLYRTHNSIISASKLISLERGCKVDTAKKRIKGARYIDLNAYGSTWKIHVS